MTSSDQTRALTVWVDRCLGAESQLEATRLCVYTALQMEKTFRNECEDEFCSVCTEAVNDHGEIDHNKDCPIRYLELLLSGWTPKVEDIASL